MKPFWYSSRDLLYPPHESTESTTDHLLEQLRLHPEQFSVSPVFDADNNLSGFYIESVPDKNSSAHHARRLLVTADIPLNEARSSLLRHIDEQFEEVEELIDSLQIEISSAHSAKSAAFSTKILTHLNQHDTPVPNDTLAEEERALEELRKSNDELEELLSTIARERNVLHEKIYRGVFLPDSSAPRNEEAVDATAQGTVALWHARYQKIERDVHADRLALPLGKDSPFR